MTKLRKDIKNFRNFLVMFYITISILVLLAGLINKYFVGNSNYELFYISVAFAAVGIINIITFETINMILNDYEKKLLGENNDHND